MTKLEKVQPVALSEDIQADLDELLSYQNNIVFHRVSAFENAVMFGKKIIHMKKSGKIPKGKFKQWVIEHVSFVKYRMIANYMNIAKNEDLLRLKLGESLEIKKSIQWLTKQNKLSKTQEEVKQSLEVVSKKIDESAIKLERAKRALRSNRVHKIQSPEREKLKEEYQDKAERKSNLIKAQKKTLSRYEEHLLLLSTAEEKQQYLTERRQELEEELTSIDELLKSIS